MELVIIFLIGMLIGAIITSMIIDVYAAKAVFRIDHSNPEKDVYRLDIGDLKAIDSRKYLRLKIDHHADLSRK